MERDRDREQNRESGQSGRHNEGSDRNTTKQSPGGSSGGGRQGTSQSERDDKGGMSKKK